VVKDEKYEKYEELGFKRIFAAKLCCFRFYFTIFFTAYKQFSPNCAQSSSFTQAPPNQYYVVSVQSKQTAGTVIKSLN
jgi:hypothetical protein